LGNYGSVALYAVVAVLFTLSMVVIPIILRFLKLVPNHPSQVKNDAFECGMKTIGETWVQFNFHYYFYALMFLALDVLVVFLYPWAVALRQLGAGSLILIVIVLFFVLVGYLYAWKKRVLEWK